MAKKRKLARNSTPSSNSEPETPSQPESETPSQPEPKPIEEDQPPIEEDHIDQEQEEDAGVVEEQEAADDEVVEDEEKQDGGEDHKPQTLETTDPAAAGDNNDDLSDPQSIQKIIELFPKEQLVDLLRDAAFKHADILKEVHRIADLDPAHRKIFVHGLGWDTNATNLTDFFRQYGEIEDCKAVTDKATGKSKGYGFILFKHRKGAQNALKEPQKKIGNRMTACQLATLGPVHIPLPDPPATEYTQRKIFVSNVGTEIDPQKLLQFFAKFGEIEEGPLGLDRATGKPRGFCLFVYKSVESAKKALEEPHKNFEGHLLHCQKAIDGTKNKFQYQHSASAHYSGGVNVPNSSFSSGVGLNAVGHLMAPTSTGIGYNPASALVAAGAPVSSVPGLNPVFNQALAAMLLGGLGSVAGPVVNQGGMGAGSGTMQGGYESGQMGYRGQAQGGYGGAQGGSMRGQQGYGHGHGGGPPYMGHH